MAAGNGGVDAAENFGGGLDFNAVHGEEETGGPVHEALADGIAYCFYDFAHGSTGFLAG